MATATSLPRRLAGALVALLLAVLTLGATAGTASAADGYKYWNYFHVEGGKYVFAQTGPADYTPKNGAVEAYRYGLSSTAKGLTPRTGATTYSFAKLCQGTKAQSGQKLVGVLIDYGTKADAENGDTPADPRGACAAVPAKANGQQVLDAVADVRVEGGLTCGIDGYPTAGCSVTVKNPPAAQAQQDVAFTLPAAASDKTSDSTKAASSQDSQDSQDSGTPWALVVIVAAVVVIGAAALLLARRSRSA